MQALYALLAGLAGFAIVILVEPTWIRVALERGFTGRDMNKPQEVIVAESGGIWAIVGAVFGLLLLEAVYTYIDGVRYHATEIYALTSLLLLATLLGFVDDLLGWKKGLPPWQRVLFMAPISLPLVVIKAGVSKLSLPFIGVIDLGLAYPLVAVPIGVLGAANAFNMIAGYNGLEAGMGLLLMVFTTIYAYIKGLDLVFQASLVMALSLLGFLLYNWYPARVFPGNSFTYGVGAYYASLVVIGNMEKFGLTLFSLYFIEFILFVRGLANGVYKENFGVPKHDGTLETPYDKCYSITHVAIVLQRRLRGKATERGVVLTILAVQILVGIVVLTLAHLGIL